MVGLTACVSEPQWASSWVGVLPVHAGLALGGDRNASVRLLADLGVYTSSVSSDHWEVCAVSISKISLAVTCFLGRVLSLLPSLGA